MKRIKLLIFGLLLSSGLIASEGQGTGNGGDHIAQDFVISAVKGLEVLKSKASYFPFIDLAAVENSIKSAEIVLLKKGEAFDNFIRTAENYPEQNKIIINIDRWNQVKDPNRKMALSLHEYFGLTNYEVNNYSITGFLFGFTGNEVELVPNILELEQSFKSSKSYFNSLLNNASNLAFERWNGAYTNKLSSSQCELFLRKTLRKERSFGYFCRDRGEYGGVYLLKVSGVTQYDLNFTHVLISVYKNTIQGSSKSMFYIDSKGNVVKSSGYDKNNSGSIIETVSSVDENGNIFTLASQLSMRGRLTSEAYVVLGDGSLGTYLYNKKINGISDETVYSTAISHDWNNFSVSLFNGALSNSEDGTLRGAGKWSIVYNYDYLGRNYSRPDNYRSIKYWHRRSGDDMVEGKYVVNRRIYSIR